MDQGYVEFKKFFAWLVVPPGSTCLQKLERERRSDERGARSPERNFLLSGDGLS